LRFWYPDRARAKFEYKDRAEADGRKYDVVTIVPEGGRPFEFWIDVDSKLIERLVEREADVTRTEVYSDRREVQGVRIPFHVHTSRGDPKFDEVVDVQKLVFNESVTSVAFGPPVAKAEVSFPAGRASAEVPFEALSGHLFVKVLLDGRGPFRMLFDAGGDQHPHCADCRRYRRSGAGAGQDDQRCQHRHRTASSSAASVTRSPTSTPSCAVWKASPTSAECSGSSGSCACRSASTTRARASRSTIRGNSRRQRHQGGSGQARAAAAGQRHARRHRGHVRDRHGKPRLVDADAGVRDEERSREENSRRRTSRSRAPVSPVPCARRSRVRNR
jgi:hypothetical protein